MPAKHGAWQFSLPVLAFAITIIIGSVLLYLDATTQGHDVSYVDTLFVATSAVCITGLSSIDHSHLFSHVGHSVMLVLIQLGGLGIMTYSALLFYTFSKRISLDNRISVSDAILVSSSFDLGHFLQRLLITVICIETSGALLIYVLYPGEVSLFHSFFLAISAFCNAGFALWSDNLMGWENRMGMNVIIMSLIVVGGIGFFVLDEIIRKILFKRFQIDSAFSRAKALPDNKLSFHSRIVLSTTLALILGGAALIFFCESFNSQWKHFSTGDRAIVSLFHSISSRTAGFASIDLTRLTNLSLLFLMGLMFIGGSPGSCSGGIKTTTFRTLLAYAYSRLLGRSQVVLGGRAVEQKVLAKTMQLFFFSFIILLLSTFLLSITENGTAHYGEAKVPLMSLLFEIISAFGTVGLSMNLTPTISVPGKLILCMLMFIGRLGPIWLLNTLQQFHTELKYKYPETNLPIG